MIPLKDVYLFIYLFNNIYTGSKYLLQKLFFLQSPDEKVITNTNGFQKILDESNGKPNKIWFDKGIEFYKSSMKSFLKNNNIEMYSTHNEKNLLLLKDLLEA